MKRRAAHILGLAQLLGNGTARPALLHILGIIATIGV